MSASADSVEKVVVAYAVLLPLWPGLEFVWRLHEPVMQELFVYQRSP
jgi:hypothetical protein